MRPIFLFLSFFFFLQADAGKSNLEKKPEKILLIKVDKAGMISVGRDSLSADDLAVYVQERLFKSYMGTGKMHDRIKFEQADNGIADEVIQVIVKEIQAGQKRALIELCLQKYKKLFENIEPRQQEKLKKQYPVLFQTDYA